MAQTALRNLENRSREVQAVGDMQLRAMQAGLVARPDWLDQPARLFSKGKQPEEALDAEHAKPRPEPSREELNERLSEGVSEAAARRYLKLAGNLSDENLRALMDVSGGDPEMARKFLSRGERSGDVAGFTNRLVDVLQSLSPQQQAAMRPVWSGMKTDTLNTLVNSLTALRALSGAEGHFQKLVDAATREGRIEAEAVDRIARVARNVSSEEMAGLLAHAPDPEVAQRLLVRAAAAEDPGTFVRDVTRVLNSLEGDALTQVRKALLDLTPDVLYPVVAGLARLRNQVPDDAMYRAFVNAVMETPARKTDVLNGLNHLMENIDARGRMALASLLDQVAAGSRYRIPLGLEWMRVALEPIEQQLLGVSDGRLTNLLIEMAATQRNWIVALNDAVTLLTVLSKLPTTPENEANIARVLEYFARSRGDGSVPPKDMAAVRNNYELDQLAADISAAAEALRTSPNPSATLSDQVKRLQGDSGRLAGENAWRTHLENEKVFWPELKADPATRPFAELIEKVAPNWDDGERASLRYMQAWFDRLAEIRGIAPGDAAGREALLREVFARGFGTKEQSLRSEGKFDDLARAFREMTVEADLKINPKKVDITEALSRIGLTEEALAKRSDADVIRKHLTVLVEREIYYQKMLEIAMAIGGSTAGIRQNLTEVVGEIALSRHMIEKFSDFRLEMPFGKGTGFDQVWVRRDAGGKILEIIVGEAKGPGATLGSPTKGGQMTARWVLATIKEMQARGGDIQKLANEMMEVVERSIDEKRKELIRGRVIEAQAGDYEPLDRTTPETGEDGYDFSGLI
jgi:hypothetical protein